MRWAIRFIVLMACGALLFAIIAAQWETTGNSDQALSGNQDSSLLSSEADSEPPGSTDGSSGESPRLATRPPGDREPAADDASSAEFRSPLVRSVAESVEKSGGVLDGAQDSISATLRTADDVLEEARQRNRAALRGVNRQQRIGKRSPHVVLLVVEDLDCDDLGCYGQTLLATPRLDDIASQGIRMTRFAGLSAGHGAELDALWTGDAVAAPSRSSAGSARQPGAKARSAGGTRLTFPQFLWQAGYSTALFGDCSWASYDGDNVGIWDHRFGWLPTSHAGSAGAGGVPFSLTPAAVSSNGRRLRVPANEAGTERGPAESDTPAATSIDFSQLLLSEIRGWMAAQGRSNRPLALVIALPLAWCGQLPPKALPATQTDWTERQRQHAAAVNNLDGIVGRLVDDLDQTAPPRRTIFCVVGLPREDAHPELALFQNSESDRDERAGSQEKRAKWPPAPLLVRWTGQLPAGETRDGRCGFQDLLPTLAEMTESTQQPLRGIGRSQWSEWTDFARGTGSH